MICITSMKKTKANIFCIMVSPQLSCIFKIYKAVSEERFLHNKD